MVYPLSQRPNRASARAAMISPVRAPLAPRDDRQAPQDEEAAG